MKILVAYDGSEDAKEGLKLAQRFLKDEAGEVHVITVVAKRDDMTKEELEKLRLQGEELLNEARSLVKNYLIKTQLVEDYSVAEAILKTAEKLDADLLIMGARGKRPDILRFTLGSTASKVVAFAPCSAFIVRKRVKEE